MSKLCVIGDHVIQDLPDALDEIEQLRTQVNRMLPLVEAAQQWFRVETTTEGAGAHMALAQAIVAYETGKTFPKFIAIGEPKGTAVRHEGNGVYYRDAGAWETQARWSAEGKLEVAQPTPEEPDWSKVRPGVPITREQWANDNKGTVQ